MFEHFASASPRFPGRLTRTVCLLLLSAGLLGVFGCASSSEASGRWSGNLARTYDADIGSVVDASAGAVQQIGMGFERRQVDEQTYVVEATKKSSNSLEGQRVQLAGLSVYVRDLGDVGTNLQVRIPGQGGNYASRRDDSYARRQANRILTLLDEQFTESEMVQ